MDQRCLILSGRLLNGQQPDTVHARLAAAFGMEADGFRERVFERAPLIIRRDLDLATAETQMAQLRGMGAEADIWPDTDRLAWLRRDNTIRGPLPTDALACYAQPGDQWCHDGGETWFAWQPESMGATPPVPESELQPEPHLDAASESTSGSEWESASATESAPESVSQPEPEPELAATEASLDHDGESPLPPHIPEDARSEPPPLPPSTPVATPARTPLATSAVLAAVFGLLALLFHALAPLAALFALGVLIYLYRRPLLRGRAWAVAGLVVSATAFGLWMERPAPTPVVQPYVPRPLKPMALGAAAAGESPAQCASEAATPKNDEDRFLLTGQRMLTGRAQRKGDTYVAEAAVSVDPQCQPSALQLYVFRHGVFIGTALEQAASTATTRLADFDLTDDQHLRITLAQCTDKPNDCATTAIRQIAVLPGAGGWTLGEMK
ncbi:hypothetical protein DVT68_08295 [Dyella solisilvae]|uniref:Uncharacterized protein n=1 Tax=Dyella solisilvae TaxID=1920168 RepID=A0A370K775_9GAMM|nr:hypothetical protein [Dyella solisilvae]RDI98521.1 hypothetical protein DVT68_08295 [Dyella solisilvae]